MSKWYVIGGGSSFDADMDYSEIAVDLYNRGDETDIKVYYNFFKSKALKYFSEFVDFYNTEDVNVYLNEIKSYNTEHIRSRFVLKFNSFKQKYSLQDVQKIFDEHMENWSDRHRGLKYYSEVPDYINDMPESKKKTYALGSFRNDRYRTLQQFELEVMETFAFLSKILCFIDLKGDDRTSGNIHRMHLKGNLSPITNHTGWFAFNSYMFALINEVHLLGIPSGISAYDGTVDCPYHFLNHDLTHTDDIIDAYQHRHKNVRMVYENILKGDYIKQQKEALVFALWYHMHESTRRVDSSVRYPNSFAISDDEMANYLEVFHHIDLKIRKDIRENFEAVFGWLNEVDRTVDINSNDIPRFINKITLSITTSDILKFLDGNQDSTDVLPSTKEDWNLWKTDPRRLRVFVMIWYGYYKLFQLMSSLKLQ